MGAMIPFARFITRLAGISIGGLLMAQSPADLTKVFDRYLAAVKARDFQKVVAVYHSEAKNW
jgi:hypothetical protein